MAELKAVLLVGGLGTRLRSAVPTGPKALAKVGDRPFLELLVQQLAVQGITRLVMCTGYLADEIEKVFGDGSRFGLVIEYSREVTPLGTAGALKLAKPYLENEAEFLVLNGDSFVEINFHKLLMFHRKNRGVASVAAIPIENAGRYGTVQVTGDARIERFLEKTGLDVPGAINAGVYLFNGEILDEIPDGPASLERDVIPKLLARGVFAFESHGTFIDIGTPDDYARANAMFERLSNIAHGSKIAQTHREG